VKTFYTTLCSFQGASGSRHKNFYFTGGLSNSRLNVNQGPDRCLRHGASQALPLSLLVALPLPLHEAAHQYPHSGDEAYESPVPGDLAETGDADRPSDGP